jgi:3-phenylpropionate/cinnamic acid dioxygenase small subunit
LVPERRVLEGLFPATRHRSNPIPRRSPTTVAGPRSSPRDAAARMTTDVEQLLYHEAFLLDSGGFHEWLELLAPDVRYWAPVRASLSREQEREGEANRLPLFDETKASLALRISRLDTGLAWVENPSSRTRRFVTNIAVRQEASGLVSVRSNLLVFRSRSFADETILVGCREDKWSGSDKRLLRERKILIDHCTVENMSLIL